MTFTKAALTFAQQADLLRSRGMVGDHGVIVARLAQVNYYRLSAYWHPFRRRDSTGAILDQFQPGAAFDVVWDRYVFDRFLRLLVLDPIERLEVAVKTKLAYQHAHQNGPFGYADDPATLPRLNALERNKFLVGIEGVLRDSKEPFAEHFRDKYGTSHRHPPVWVACELLSFGGVVTFYRGSADPVRQEIGADFGVHDKVLHSWLIAANAIRNICAHHGRLWNRILGAKPMIPNRDVRWTSPVGVPNDRLFGMLTVFRAGLARVVPQSSWYDRLDELLARSPHIPLKDMGFPPNWRDCPIWAIPPESTASAAVGKDSQHAD